MGIGIRRALIAAVAAPVALVGSLAILLLGLPVWVVGGSIRISAWLFRRLGPQAVPWQELMMFEPELGWRLQPDLDVVASGDVLFHVTTDPEGWRGRDASLEQADVVVVGDSFAFGFGVDDRDFYAAKVTFPVKAVAAPAYSMVHGLLMMERLGERLRGKLVVWFIYYGNDLYENLRPNVGIYRTPFVRQATGRDGEAEWEVVASHVRSDPWPVDVPRRYLQRLAELCSSGPLAERAFSASRHLIERAGEVTGSAGARLVVVGIPDFLQLTGAGVARLTSLLSKPGLIDPEAPDRALARICHEAEIPFVPLRRHVTRADYKADDCHWTPAGHARVAQVLEELHRTARPVEVAGTGTPTFMHGTGRATV
jgi:hypothetical protein